MKFSSAQIHMLYELAEDHPEGSTGYWFFPDRQRKTGKILSAIGLVEQEPGYSKYKVGYRLTQAGGDLIEAWDTR